MVGVVPTASYTENELCPNSIPTEHSWDSAAALISHFTATVNCCLGERKAQSWSLSKKSLSR